MGNPVKKKNASQSVTMKGTSVGAGGCGVLVSLSPFIRITKKRGAPDRKREGGT